MGYVVNKRELIHLSCVQVTVFHAIVHKPDITFKMYSLSGLSSSQKVKILVEITLMIFSELRKLSFSLWITVFAIDSEQKNSYMISNKILTYKGRFYGHIFSVKRPTVNKWGICGNLRPVFYRKTGLRF